MLTEPIVTHEFDHSSGIARIVINRPDVLNAVDRATAISLAEAVHHTVAIDGLRCILLSSTGRAFVAGGDVNAFADPAKAGDAISEILDPLHGALLTLRKSKAPVVTAIHGFAAGAGFALALWGDLVFAAESAKFGVAYTQLGGTPDCGLTWSLSRRVGAAKALEIIMSNIAIDAPQAKDWGIVTDVFPDEKFKASVEERVMAIAKGPTLAYAACRTLLESNLPLADQLEKERDTFVALTKTHDFAEGVSAFLARTPPEFTGS